MSANITLDALERKVQEIQALSLIYNDTDGEEKNDHFANDTNCAKTSFKILTTDEFDEAQNLVEKYQNGDYSDITTSPAGLSSLRVELHLVIESDEEEETNKPTNKKFGEARVHFTLPPNYLNDEESSPVSVSVVSIGNMNRSKRDEVTNILNGKAQEYAESSSESIMLLIQDLQDTISCIQEEDEIEQDVENDVEGINGISAVSSSFSRRWIWVHHITNSGRIESIVQEANDLSLNGYLKSGYPGVCVVEGLSSKCDQFVQWIKGNKSRPGGFGRQWGHHVRGQIEFQEDEKDESSSESGRGFTNEKFEHVGEGLGDLADKCRNINSWMEGEFKAYVMQH
jgi:acylphosphatase